MTLKKTKSQKSNFVGDQIAAARKAKSMSQRQLAAEAGVERCTLMRIEKGEVGNMETIDKIARALGMRLVVRVEE
ncbi:MAG: helix-turn-helix transcriptional regulator [Patescibacteria group bacterium]|nr:helix-turn-helix transcriptional regulator [Patescibacteria group bacterium]